jgi:predicted nucleotidyltransferase
MSTGPVEKALRRAVRDLREIGVDFALVGGLAVVIRGSERTTKDVDFVVAVPSDVVAEQVLHAMLQRGYTVDCILEQTTVGRLATARLVPPGREVRKAIVDLLFCVTGIEAEIAEVADLLQCFDDLRLKVATTGHLIAMKVLSHDAETRGKDQDDLIALLHVASEGDLNLARKSISLMHERGLGRDKDLLAFLGQLTRRVKSSPRSGQSTEALQSMAGRGILPRTSNKRVRKPGAREIARTHRRKRPPK